MPNENKKIMHRERRQRSITKAVTYRAVSIAADSLVAFMITKSAEKTLIFVAISNFISIFIYFIHERLWNRVPWGRHILRE